jgi:thiamine-phosphate pyrophosphorylase
VNELEKLYRTVDANVNRASEGARVLEDIARFLYNNQELSSKLREIRHKIRSNIENIFLKCICKRDSQSDVGQTVSKNSNIDNKENICELIVANFKRMQEAVRTIEETLKLLDNYKLSKEYEDIRFESYMIEKEYIQKIFFDKLKNFKTGGLYCITAYGFSKGRNNIEIVKDMVKSDVKIIQYREKDKSMLERYNECMQIREITKENDVTFIVNDDIHIAMAVKADGVHLGQDDMPIEKARELLGNNMIIGLSTHSPKQCIEAIEKGVDYIGVGPIFKTYTKKDVCDPVGLSYLEYVVKNTDIPFVAIGGIKEANIDSVLRKGARTVALVTEIVGAENVGNKIRKLRSKFKEYIGG